jgi:hypothetical protein
VQKESVAAFEAAVRTHAKRGRSAAHTAERPGAASRSTKRR